MITLNQFVKSSASELNGNSLLQENVLSLNGVNRQIADILKLQNIESIFDLATSRDFNTAYKMVQGKELLKDGYQNFAQKGLIPKDVLPFDPEMKPTDIPHVSIRKLSFIPENVADFYATILSISTVQEMAYWPPFQGALKILQETFNINNSISDDNQDLYSDLVPSTGNYPIERVFYKRYFLDTIGAIDLGGEPEFIPTSPEEIEILVELNQERLEESKQTAQEKKSEKDTLKASLKNISEQLLIVSSGLPTLKRSLSEHIKSHNFSREMLDSVNNNLLTEEEAFLKLTDFLRNSIFTSPAQFDLLIGENNTIDLMRIFLSNRVTELQNEHDAKQSSTDQATSEKEELIKQIKQAENEWLQSTREVKYYEGEEIKLRNLVTELQSKNWIPLETTGPVDMFESQKLRSGFEEPSVGVEITMAQSWYAEGVALGQLLHSLALAPGESTRIAVIDWQRQVVGVTQEETGQQEFLAANSNQKRAISEVTEAVAKEFQEGDSKGTSSSNSSQEASNLSGGAIVVSGGESDSSSSNSAVATNVAYTEGFKHIEAQAIQEVNNSIHQNASSARTRRAAIVQETFQNESERTTTRVITNYNHMHAMSIQYYEVVQIYKVKTEIQEMNRVLYLPMKYFDFFDPRVIERFRDLLMRKVLRRMSIDPFAPQAYEQLKAFDAGYQLEFLIPNWLEQDREKFRSLKIFAKEQIERLKEFGTNIGIGRSTLFKEPWLNNEVKDIKLWLRRELSRLKDKRESLYKIGKDQSERGSRILRANIPIVFGRDPKISNLNGSIKIESIDFGRNPIMFATNGSFTQLSPGPRSIGIDAEGNPTQTVGEPSRTIISPFNRNSFNFSIKTINVYPFPEGTDPIKITGENGLFEINAEINSIRDIHRITIELNSSLTEDDLLVSVPCNISFRTEDDRAVKIQYDLAAPVGVAEIEFFEIKQPSLSDDLQKYLDGKSIHFSHYIWRNLSKEEYSQILADLTHKGRRIGSFVDPVPVAITGNLIGFRWHFATKDERLAFENFYQKKTDRQDITIPLPSSGVFAEAVLGRSNSAEKLDMTRFWNWQDSPIPILPPEIAAIQTGSRNAGAPPTTSNLEEQIARLQTLNALPNPTGLNGALNALTISNMFKDMSGGDSLGEIIKNAQQVTNAGATSAGETNQKNVEAFQNYQKELIKTYLEHQQKMSEIAAPLITGAATGGAGLGASSVSKAGAVMNMASSIDKSSGKEEASKPTAKKSAFQSLLGLFGGKGKK